MKIRISLLEGAQNRAGTHPNFCLVLVTMRVNSSPLRFLEKRKALCHLVVYNEHQRLNSQNQGVWECLPLI